MATEVIFPKVDMDMEAGSITEWLKSEGDQVAAGEPLFVIETDKASMEIEAPGSGYLAGITGALDTPILVGKTVAWIIASKDDNVPSGQQASAEETATTSNPVPATSVADTDLPVDTSTVRASPAARRTAHELSVDLSTVQGSSLRGRIVANDVIAVAEDITHKRAGNTNAQTVPHNSMRKSLAKRLQASIQEVPAFQLSVDIDCKNLINTRHQLRVVQQRRAVSQDDAFPTINDFAIKALALALQDFPVANCSWAEDVMHWHSSSDVAIAVAVENGVLAPVIRQAETKSLQNIASEARQLAKRARENKLAPVEYQGGATTVSNLGMYGAGSFSSIIVPPQASIVSLGAVRETALVKEGRVRAGKVFTATFTFDHRVIDGVPGAELAAAFRHYLENPVGLLTE